MIQINTERLVIRNFVPQDWPALKELIVWYMSSPYAAYDQPWPLSNKEIRHICQHFSSGDHFMAVTLRSGGSLIGYIALNPTEDADVYNLGYCFFGLYHGQGYAYEACVKVIIHAFNVMGAEKIVTGTALENAPSTKLLEKLGFRMITSGPCSFRKDRTGTPIVFTGQEYVLEKQQK